METARRTDWVIQAVIAGICLLALAFSVLYTMLGEIVLGAWQVISALLNTLPMYRSPYRNRITIYWILTSISLLLLATGNDVLMIVSVAGSWGIAVYYWIIYKSFIEHVTHRKELDTVIRH